MPIFNAPFVVQRYELRGRTWFRWDRHSNGQVDHYFCIGQLDKSGHWNSLSATMSGSYDPHCSCCWLGFGHTEDYHKQQVQPGEVDSQDRRSYVGGL